MEKIKLKIKPIEWSKDEYGNLVFYGVNQMSMFVITPLKNGDFHCFIQINKQQESFTVSDIEDAKLKCSNIHCEIVKSRCNAIFRSFTDNDIEFE